MKLGLQLSTGMIFFADTKENIEMDNSQSQYERVDNRAKTTYNPLVSIITAVLNGVKYLEPCIESVLNQSYPHIEHIFIDGGSTDATLDVLSRYSTKYPDRVRFISEPDEGRDEAANKGVQIAKGEIFEFLGSDDMLEPDAIQTVVEFFRSNPDAYFVFGDCNYINEKGEVIKKVPTEDFNLKTIVNKRFYVPMTSAFYKREVFKKVGLYYVNPEAAFVSDTDFIIRVGRAFPIHRIEQVLSSFRMHHWVFSGDSWERSKKGIRNIYLVTRQNGGGIFSWCSRIYYASLIVDWLRPLLGPIYPFIEKMVDKYRFKNR